jgi:hypothetical protein
MNHLSKTHNFAIVNFSKIEMTQIYCNLGSLDKITCPQA